ARLAAIGRNIVLGGSRLSHNSPEILPSQFAHSPILERSSPIRPGLAQKSAIQERFRSWDLSPPDVLFRDGFLDAAGDAAMLKQGHQPVARMHLVGTANNFLAFLAR